VARVRGLHRKPLFQNLYRKPVSGERGYFRMNNVDLGTFTFFRLYQFVRSKPCGLEDSWIERTEQDDGRALGITLRNRHG
jgi:hypothetical protein